MSMGLKLMMMSEGEELETPSTALASPERNLERRSLFTLLEKPKRYYSRKEKVKSNLGEKFKAAIDDNMSAFSSSLLQCKNDENLLNDPISETSDRCYDDIEKDDKYNVNEALVSSNQCKTGISKNYHWNEDDNDLCLSISTQEILDQNEKINNNFPNISKIPVNTQITQATVGNVTTIFGGFIQKILQTYYI
uniref:Uncharacterized protein n=1 Tax=Glossina austeni TaxID=7395 RepID=A0A1A9VNW0_GLOAU